MNDQSPWRTQFSNKKRMHPGKAAAILTGIFFIIVIILLAAVFGAIQFIKWAIEF